MSFGSRGVRVLRHRNALTEKALENTLQKLSKYVKCKVTAALKVEGFRYQLILRLHQAFLVDIPHHEPSSASARLQLILRIKLGNNSRPPRLQTLKLSYRVLKAQNFQREQSNIFGNTFSW